MTPTDLDPAALLDALHAALDADPSGAATRLMLADLLQDAGDPVAARGQRWQAGHGKRPVPRQAGGRAVDEWRWWDAAYSEQDDPDDIPSDVFRLLPGRGGQNLACYYPSRRDAEADLALALESLARRRAAEDGYDGEPCPWCGERKRSFGHCDGCGRWWGA